MENTMETVPSQEVVVARYYWKIGKIAEQKEEVKAWLTKNTTNGIPWVLRVLPGFEEEVNNAFPGVLGMMSRGQNNGCVNGTALLQTDYKVHTVGGKYRPKFLYRAFHSEIPNNGIKSRLGRGTDPIFLHIHLRKHLRWRCREASPFLSATNDWAKAVRIALLYEKRGHTGIKIIKFATNGEGWDHNVQRMWRARSLLYQMGLKNDNRKYLDNEYLIEHSIPEASIVKVYDWIDRQKFLDPSGRVQNQVRLELKEKQRASDLKKERRAQERMRVDEERKKRKLDSPDGPVAEDVRVVGKRVKVGPKMGPNVAGA
ncbi:hypothetical protein CkaCkLH20_11407 [Colletotrichum karsti]|uniref:DUF7587 domain-containing protein n=1 Tax=Colletotrichum karsti TaxID=1095194 RepID=A0A9P6LFV8_9PEZI|nr:uncharacterized protein CkaCkLH20_11407 [Colletotrichum karsti]KAF9870990.1 hypothetical protein CkaCkLH20_11407 [Colletotrichum karsti]